MRSNKSNQDRLKDKKADPYKSYSYQPQPGMMFKTVYIALTPAPAWCYAQQLSQSLTWEAAQYGNEETRLFVFNKGITIKPYDYVRYRDKWYQVTRVDTTDDYNTDVYVYVKDAPTGGIPSADEIKPYGWEPGDDQ